MIKRDKDNLDAQKPKKREKRKDHTVRPEPLTKIKRTSFLDIDEPKRWLPATTKLALAPVSPNLYFNLKLNVDNFTKLRFFLILIL